MIELWREIWRAPDMCVSGRHMLPVLYICRSILSMLHEACDGNSTAVYV